VDYNKPLPSVKPYFLNPEAFTHIQPIAVILHIRNLSFASPSLAILPPLSADLTEEDVDLCGISELLVTYPEALILIPCFPVFLPRANTFQLLHLCSTVFSIL
jgi:hypothetical protein